MEKFSEMLQVIHTQFYEKCHSPKGFFRLFAKANHLPGFCINQPSEKKGLSESVI